MRAATIAPPLGENGSGRPGVKQYLPWMPDWLDLNVMVPLIATVIVVFVGVLVVCVALTRRNMTDPRNGPKDVYCRFFSAAGGTDRMMTEAKTKFQKSIV